MFEHNVVPVILVNTYGNHHAGGLSPYQIRMPTCRLGVRIFQVWRTYPILYRLERWETGRPFEGGEVLRCGRPECDEILPEFQLSLCARGKGVDIHQNLGS